MISFRTVQIVLYIVSWYKNMYIILTYDIDNSNKLDKARSFNLGSHIDHTQQHTDRKTLDIVSGRKLNTPNSVYYVWSYVCLIQGQ